MATIIDELEIRVNSNGLDALMARLDKVAQSFEGCRKAAERFAAATQSVDRRVSATKKISGGTLKDYGMDKLLDMSQVEMLDRKLGLTMDKAMAAAGRGDDLGAIRAVEQVQKLQAQYDKLTTSAEGAAKVTEKVAKATNTAAKAATRATSRLSSLLRTFAGMRLLRSAIRTMVSGFQEGLSNAYQFSDGIGGKLSTALDALSTKSQTMKNQLGAAFGELLINITPALTKLIELVTKAADAFSRLFAVLGGRSTYTRAVDTTQKWADSATAAGAAASEWKNQLMGFDEINRLEESSSGGGASVTDYGSKFEDIPIPEFSISAMIDKLSDAFGQLGDWIANYDWQGLGRTVYDRISEALSGDVDWAGLTQDLSYSLGAVFGAAFGFLYGFIDEAWSQGLAPYLQQRVEDAGGSIPRAFWSGVVDAFHFIAEIRQWLKTNVAEPFYDGLLSAFGLDTDNSTVSEIGGFLSDGFVNGIINHIPWLRSLDFIYVVFGTLIEGIKRLFGIHSPSTVMAEIGRNIMNGLINGLTEKWNSLKTCWSSITKIFTETDWGSVIRSIGNGVIGTLNSVIRTVNELGHISFPGVNFAGMQVIPSFSTTLWVIPQLASFATGGFPEDGLFFANHNELVGQFSNGRTAVANNKQITEGISAAVAEAEQEQNSLIRQQNELLRQLLAKNGSVVIAPSVALGRTVSKSLDMYAGVVG